MDLGILGIVSTLSAAAGALANRILDRRTEHERRAWAEVDGLKSQCARLEERLDQLGRQLDRTQDQLRESQSSEVRLHVRVEMLEAEKAGLLEGYQRRGDEMASMRGELDALRRQVGPPEHQEEHQEEP